MAAIGSTDSKSPPDELRISVWNEVEETKRKQAPEVAEPPQTSSPQDAVSLASDGNRMEARWFRSMSQLAETHYVEQKKIPSPAKVEDSTNNADKKWYRTIIEVGRRTADSHPQRKKFSKVPPMLRRNESKKQNLYSPSVVCIGPYHYEKKKLRQGELKAKMAYKFVEGNGEGGDETERLEKLFKKVEAVSHDVKKCYNSDGSTSEIISNDKEFARMMFLDACFVLQFIHWSISDYHSLMSVMNDHLAQAVRRDLLLLENQLPFQVLTSLMGGKEREWEFRFGRYFVHYVFRFHSPKVSVWRVLIEVYKVLKMLSCVSVYHAFKAPSQEISQGEAFQGNPQHLLAFFHSRLIHKQKIEETVGKRHLRYSAKELKRVGIKFEANWTCFITDIKYGKTLLAGKLKLPQLTVDGSTKSMLLNLVAYEYCHESVEKRWVTSYICFMDSLIDDVEDVEVLRKSGILFNFRETDQAVADLFNNMGTYLIPNLSAYVDAKRSIHSHCKNTIKKWVAEFWDVYFRSPWTIIAVVAAALAIFLTAIQTYFAAFPHKGQKL